MHVWERKCTDEPGASGAREIRKLTKTPIRDASKCLKSLLEKIPTIHVTIGVSIRVIITRK